MIISYHFSLNVKMYRYRQKVSKWYFCTVTGNPAHDYRPRRRCERCNSSSHNVGWTCTAKSNYNLTYWACPYLCTKKEKQSHSFTIRFIIIANVKYKIKTSKDKDVYSILSNMLCSRTLAYSCIYLPLFLMIYSGDNGICSIHSSSVSINTYNL